MLSQSYLWARVDDNGARVEAVADIGHLVGVDADGGEVNGGGPHARHQLGWRGVQVLVVLWQTHHERVSVK